MGTTERHTPDILNCLANLSSDEVFTSPELANRMLDLLPQELFCSPKTRFLDPCSKSGVFLREIAKRLLAGLEDQIPDLQQRIDHIMTKQVFGIACTDLTAEMSRRTLYCTKQANGEYSVATAFTDKQGNLRYDRCQHTWNAQGRCECCGASQGEYLRDNCRETYAYPFIHKKINEIFKNMQFDVIIGNPPYQMSDGGGDGSSALPIYHKFILQAKKMNPRYLSMIVPARWYSGGKGLDDFRNEMLSDSRISVIHDFPITDECFQGLNIRGGICYFLWNRDYSGDCVVYNHNQDNVNCAKRPLLEQKAETFIRYNQGISILRKVRLLNEETMDNRVSSRLPFGIPSNFSDYTLSKSNEDDVVLYRSERNKNAEKRVFISKKSVEKNKVWIDRLKVLVSKASPGGDDYPHSIISNPVLAERGSVCTETYLIVDFVDTTEQGKNLISYMNTRFFRFLMSLIKNTQNISKSVFAFVPLQDFSHPWTDEMLYEKYGLDEEEIAFIESMIRPME